MKEGLQNIHRTKYRYFMDNANKFLDKTAFTYAVPIELGKTPEGCVDLNRKYEDVKISKRELIEKIETTADALWALGIREGDIVTLCSANTPELIYMDYALNKIGAIPNYVYPNLTPEEMNFFIKEVNAKHIFVLDKPEIRSMILKASEGENVKNIITSSVLQSFPPLFRMAAEGNLEFEQDDRIIPWEKFYQLGLDNKNISKECEYDEYKTSALIHTSGTTSTPKAVMQLNKNVNAIVRNYDVDEQDWIPGKKYLQVLPMFVTYGSSSFHVMFCNNIEIITLPEYNPVAFPGLVHKYHPNYLTVTPAFWGALIKSKVITDKDLSYFEIIGTGGDGFDAIEDRVISFLAQHKCHKLISDGYGNTEVSAIACSNLVNHYKKGTLGKPVGNVEIGVFDPKTKERLGTNEVGEFAITGDTVTNGYYNDPEKTKEVFRKHSDGKIWVHTGDLGRIDEEGFCHYEGRIKNIIIRQTIKIAPSNEEKIIERIPNVVECCIVALPDKNEGQVPSAHITLDNYDNVDETLSEIIKYCGEKIQPFHMPVSFKIREEIPKTKNNKNNLNALKIEDFASLIPGVVKSNIVPVYSNNCDYKLEVEVNPEIINMPENEIEGYIKDFVKQKMIEQKIAQCNILFEIKLNYSKYKDSSIVKKYAKVKFM